MIIVNGQKIEKDRFPDDTLRLLNLPQSQSLTTILWKYEKDEEFFFYAVASHYREQSKLLYLNIPYIPHARMDRVKSNEECFMLNHFANLINSINADMVFCYDPHSEACKMINNLIITDSALVSNLEKIEQVENYDYICFPDKGARDKYAAIFNNFGLFCKTVYCNKTRNWETGRIESLELATDIDLTNKTVLIVDDIVSYGGTIVRAANCLKAAGAKRVVAYCSHAEDSVFKGKVFENIDKLYTTETILRDDDNIQLYSSLGKLEVLKW